MRSRLMIAESLDEPRTLAGESVEVCAFTRASPAHPEHNEDALGLWQLADGSTVLAVADGMGGGPQGAEAAERTIRQLDRRFASTTSGEEVRRIVLDAFEAANQEVLDALPGSGTTLVVGEVVDGGVRTYNVGDSAALLVGQRGRIKLQTIAHSPVGYGVAAGLIDPETALEHEDRHYLSNHIGSRSMHVEVGSARRLAARDTLLIASDGLLDNVAPTELVEIIRRGPLERAGNRLIELAVRRMDGRDSNVEGKLDDMTFLLMRMRSG